MSSPSMLARVKSRRLSPAAMERAFGVLREYAAEIHALAARPFALGTQALREVENAAEFLGQAQAILRGPIEVISGRREAELAWRAVKVAFPELEDALVMDIGGGSTELVLAEAGLVSRAESLKLGSVRL